MRLTSVDIGSFDDHKYSAGRWVVNRTPGLGCHTVNMRKIIYVLIYEVATLLLFATQVSKLVRACFVIVF